jgi:hypothetical protein
MNADLVLEEAIEERLAMVFSAKTVTPSERKKLAPLLKYYAKFKHPFTKCVRDNTKRWGPDLAKKRCAVIKDLIMGTTKWRKGRQSANLADTDAEMFANAPDIDDDIIALLDRLEENELEQLEDIALEVHMAAEENEGQSNLIYLHLSDNTPVEEEEFTLADGKTAKVLWKDVLVEGEYPMSPGPGGATDTPMRVTVDGESDYGTKTISMSDLIQSHKDGAFKYVTIPTSHKDGVLDNTGYVPRPDGVRIVEKNGKQVFQAALGFTEPDVKGKVERGTIPDCSGGIFFNWLNKHTKKKYRAAMKHVALTPVPFMGNLDPFPAVFASDEEIPEGTKVEVYNFAEGDNVGDNTSSDKAEIIWKAENGFRFVLNQVNAALNPEQTPAADGRPVEPRPFYSVMDVSSDNTALVEEFFKGDNRRFVIPFEYKDGDVSIAPSLRWVEVREAMIAASDNDFENMAAAKVRERLTDKLGEQLDRSETIYRVEEITLDGRARVVNRAKGKQWVARYALLADDVWIEPSSDWEAIEDSKPAVTQQPVTVNQTSNGNSNVNLSRLEAARQRRRQLLSS